MSGVPLPQSANTSMFQSPAQGSVGGATETPFRPRKHPTLRPLTAAYNAASSDQRVGDLFATSCNQW